jgi:8-oxo-dGTP pyrophosphatase MutT (NUDIX family)
MKNPWKTLSSKVVYETDYLRIRQDQVIKPNGQKGTYDVLESPGSVFVIALDAEDKFVLIGQYRYPTAVFSLEVPGGGRDRESKDPLNDAKRELQEETGLIAREWSEAGRCFAYNGVSDEEMITYIARDLKQTDQAETKEEGIMEAKNVSFEEAFAMIKTGEINDSQCIAAITQAAMYLGFLPLSSRTEGERSQD